MFPLARFQLMAARFVLGIASGDELVQFGDQMLSQGIYSDALMEMATTRYAIHSEMEPLLRTALKDFSIPLPDEKEAAYQVVRYFIEDILEGRITPADAPETFYDSIYRDLQWGELGRKLWDEYGTGLLIGQCYEAEDWSARLEMALLSAEQFQQRQIEREHEILDFAHQWMTQRGQITIDPDWLRRNGGLVLQLVQSIQDERRYQNLPILADALEEVGCDNPVILQHCRGGQDHPRECWLVNLLLQQR